jgi:hypothetical protein
VVCLTATPDDGFADGNESKVINLMGYKRIKTGDKNDMIAPEINNRESLRSAYDAITLVNSYNTTRGVLIYAVGGLYDQLAQEPNVKKVTLETPPEDLRRMDIRSGGLYPVFLINDKYGIRGLDYRAAGNKLGICMIICSMFSDRRTRI